MYTVTVHIHSDSFIIITYYETVYLPPRT